MDNRRTNARYPVAVAAELEVDGEAYDGETRDISMGGVSVLIEAPLQEGESVDVTLVLIEDGVESAVEDAVTTRAEVRWIAPTDDGACLAGLRFGTLDTDISLRLRRFLTAVVEQGTTA